MPNRVTALTTTRPRFGGRAVATLWSALHQFPHTVFDHVLPGDFAAIGFAPSQRFSELHCLFDFYLGWHRRGEWIDYSFNDYRTVDLQRLVEYGSAALWIFDGESGTAAGPGECGEVDGMEIDSIFRITEKNHLFPFDLSEDIVLNDNDPYGKLIFYRRHKVRHQHGEATVPHEREHRTVWMGGSCGDRIWQAARHRRQIPRTGMHLSPLDRNVPGPPGGNCAAVAGDNRIGRQTLAELPGNHLGAHRLVFDRALLLHHLVPLAHAFLCLLQEAAIGFSLDQLA